MAHSHTSGEERPTRFRFIVIAILLIVTIMNFADRGALSFASAQIIQEFHLNKASWGAILGFFGYGYIVGGMVAGVLADRWGAKRVWIVAGAAWSVFEAATAFAGELGMTALGGSALAGFAVIRVLFGMSEGPAYVLLNKSVAAWAAPRERALMSSLVLVSAPIGALISAPLSILLLQMTGSWRAMFVILGLISIVTIVAFAVIYTNEPRKNRRVNAAELALIEQERQIASASGIAPSAPFFTKTLALNAVGFFCTLYVTFLVLTWIPKYLQDEHHVTLAAMSYMGMLPWIGACFSVIAGGLLSDRLYASTKDLRIARSRFAAVCMVISSVLLICAPSFSSAGIAILFVALANAVNQMPNSAFWIIVVDQSPSHVLGKRSGMTLVIASSASIIAPTATGYVVQAFGYGAMFYLATLVSLIGAAAMFALKFATPLTAFPDTALQARKPPP